MSYDNDNVYDEQSGVNVRETFRARTTVIFVEEVPARRPLARGLFADEVTVVEASDASDARRSIEPHTEAGRSSGEFAVLLLDLTGARPHVFDAAKKLRRAPHSAHLPMIGISSRPLDRAQVKRALLAGFTEFVELPTSPAVLSAKVRHAAEQAMLVSRLNDELRFARKHATVDELTSLGNRRGLEGRILEESAYAKRHREPFAVLLLDLDRFKEYNDRFGHVEGDAVLRHFADALRTVTRGEDIAFRYGGDEFVLLLRACNAARALDVATRLGTYLEEHPFVFANGHRETIAFSGGVASARQSEAFAGHDLVSRADVALYRAKNTGRSRVYSWEPEARSA